MADSNSSHVLVLLGDLAQQQRASEASQFISLYRCYFKYVGVATQKPPNLTFQRGKTNYSASDGHEPRFLRLLRLDFLDQQVPFVAESLSCWTSCFGISVPEPPTAGWARTKTPHSTASTGGAELIAIPPGKPRFPEPPDFA